MQLNVANVSVLFRYNAGATCGFDSSKRLYSVHSIQRRLVCIGDAIGAPYTATNLHRL